MAYFTYLDLFEMLGPNGCTAVESCFCYAETVKKRCIFNQAGNPNISKIIRNVADIVNANTSYCLASSVEQVSGLDGFELITNITRFEHMLQVRCSQHSSGTDAIVVSATNGQLNLYNYSTLTPNCAIDLSSIAEFNADTPTPEFQILKRIEIEFSTQNKFVNKYFENIIGTMPIGATIEQKFFQLRQGQPAHCVSAYFMAFSDNVIPVYKLTSPRRVYSYTIAIDGVEQSQTLVRSEASDTRIPDGTIVFGDPASMTAVYDVPRCDASLSRSSTVRNGPTYTIFSNSSCMTQTCWKATNGVEYDAKRGVAVVNQYRRTIDPLTGKCEGSDRAELGSFCATRDDFSVSDASTQTTFTHNEFEYFIRNVRVPGSEITALVYSACPTAALFRVPRGVQVTLASIQSQPITVRLNITGPCPEIRETTIPATGTTTVMIQTCPNIANPVGPNPPSQWSNLTIYRLEGTGFLECNDTRNLNVTGDRLQVLAVQGIVDSPYFQSTSSLYFDTTLSNIASLFSQIQLQQQQLSAAQIATRVQLGLPLAGDFPSTVLTGLVNQLGQQLNDSLGKFKNTSDAIAAVDLDALTRDFQNQLAAVKRNSSASFALIADLLANATRTQNLSETNFMKLLTTNAAFQALVPQLQQAILQAFSNLTFTNLVLTQAVTQVRSRPCVSLARL
jgi:hypothetical protein